MNSILDKISKSGDIKKLKKQELCTLCEEIREFLIDSISKTGGHLASNLGVVELTVMLHKIFTLPEDSLIFDVGHQSYVHKILTGRKDKFSTLRRSGGLSGFPSPSESEYDLFLTGHSSTSISSALGVATSKSLKGQKGKTIAIIGDGAITGGLAYEGLINAGRSSEEIIVILNDNEMSISKNVGSMAKYLSKIRNNASYFKTKDIVFNLLKNIPYLGTKIIRYIMSSKTALKEMLYHQTMFENMGFTYLGPVDGHDLEQLENVLLRAKILKVPVLIHINTIKGKGYTFAENSPTTFHGLPKFEILTGEVTSKSEQSFTSVFSKELLNLAGLNDKICVVTASMADGTGVLDFKEKYPKRFFDVGIAEGHAVTFCAGLAKGGFLPIFAVYSSFLQRAYDQIIHDVSLQKLKVIFAIDRAGLVGEDGQTHQGVYDTAFLNNVQNLTVLSPSNFIELRVMLDYAVNEIEGSVAVRYPRGKEHENNDETFNFSPYTINILNDNAKVLIVTYGREYYEVLQALKANNKANILKLNKIKPIEMPDDSFYSQYEKIVFIEEGIISGGIGESFLNKVAHLKKDTLLIGVNKNVKHATVSQQLASQKLDSASVLELLEGF